MKILVTGGAGFIGSHLVERLIRRGDNVVVYDNFSSGKKIFLKSILDNSRLKITDGDVLNLRKLKKEIKNHDIVYHLCANPDVRKGIFDTRLDLEQETIATYNVLEAMRQTGVGKIVFPSSMTVYGRAKGAISENYGPCLPISLYGAGKLSCEGLISAYCSIFGFTAFILRFANIIGGRATHGVIYDLIHKLLNAQRALEVLGDGKQNKPYMYIDDALDAMEFIVSHAKGIVNLFNVGSNDTISVSKIAQITIGKMRIKDVKIRYTGTPYGWKGDVPQFQLDAGKLSKFGFVPKYSSEQAAAMTVDALLDEFGYKR